MHIGVFTLRDLGIAGGGAIRVIGTTRHLSEVGCQVTLFAPGFTPQLENKVHFVPIESPKESRRRLMMLCSFFPSLNRVLKYLSTANQDLVNLINSQRVDLLHCHAHESGFLMLPTRSMLNVPIALDVHGIKRLRQESTQNRLMEGSRRCLALHTECSLFQQVDALIVRTMAERIYIAENFDITPNRIYIVPNGADVDFLGQPVNDVDKHVLRTELGLYGKRIILWAGGFKSRSGVMDLVKAFQILNSRRSDVSLVLIGDVNPLTRQVKAFIREQGLSNVILLERQSREQFHVYQQIADAVITPEIQDAYNELAVPLKLLDCLASGRPTVVTRTVSHAAIIKDGVNGFLVEPQDPADIARGIERALNDSNAVEIGQRGRQTVIENYSWRRSAQYAASAYADILQRY